MGETAWTTWKKICQALSLNRKRNMPNFSEAQTVTLWFSARHPAIFLWGNKKQTEKSCQWFHITPISHFLGPVPPRGHIKSNLPTLHRELFHFMVVGRTFLTGLMSSRSLEVDIKDVHKPELRSGKSSKKTPKNIYLCFGKWLPS